MSACRIVAGSETAYVRSPAESCCRSISRVNASVRRVGRPRHDLGDVLAAGGHTGQANRGRVAQEDLAERFTDESAEAAAAQRLRRMLARRAAAEIRVDDQQARIASHRVVERVLGAAACRFAAIVFEDVFVQTIEGDGFQKPRRDDAIRVDVVAAQDERRAGDDGNARRAHAGTASVRTSTTSPAIAAAATIAGLISSVLPVGLP